MRKRIPQSGFSIFKEIRLNWNVKRTLFLLAMLLMAGANTELYAQTVKVTGVVNDADGVGIPGATIVEKGTQNGVISDLDGNFEITVQSADAVLMFSFIGKADKEVPIAGKSTLEVILESTAVSLEEIVVVGYGQQKKESLTGAIETVSAEAFKDQTGSSPVASLQGRSAGLTVTRSSSRPGNEGVDLKIRGDVSINGGSVLIIIDGVPTSNDEFYNMSPDDIESVSILKDGSAAIYGSRAADGVILVTTKKGKKGKVSVDYTGMVKINTIGIKPPSPSMQEYATVWLEAASQDAVPNYWGWQNAENLQKMQSGYEGIYSTAYWGDVYIGNNSRFEEMFGTSVSNQHNLSVSGGNERGNYRISLGYAEDVGALQTAYDGKVKKNIRFNHNYQLTDRIKLETGIAYTNYHISSPSTGLGSTSMAHDPPFFPAQNPYGQWYANFNIAGNRNAVAATVDGGRENTKRDILTMNFAATVDIIDNLKFKTTAAFRKTHNDYQKYVVTVPQYTWYGELAPESVNSTSSIREQRKTYNYQNYGGFLMYDKKVSDHSFSGTIGVTAELSADKTTYGYRLGFEDVGVYDINLGSLAESIEATGGQGHVGFYSYIGRFNYSYKDRYLLELQGRRDGSSKFHEDYRWSNFFGGSAGWIVTREDFMKPLENVLNFTKLRVSYGEMGGQQGVGMYDYISSIILGSSVFGDAAALQNTARIAQLTSFDRTWERIGDLTAGIDFHLLDSKFQGTFDYFFKRNNGMFVSEKLPAVLGGDPPKTNAGIMDVRGWEASLTYRDKVGDVEYSVSLNMSDSRTHLTDLEGNETLREGILNNNGNWREGVPIRAIYVYETDGFFKDEAEVDEYYEKYGGKGNVDALKGDNRLRPGDTKVVDRNGDNVIDKDDLKLFGDANPHYVFGINLGLKWKGFDFSSFFQGVLQQNVLRSGWMQYPFYAIWTNQTSAYIGKTWTPENTGAEYPRMTAYTDLSEWNWKYKDFSVQKNRYIRLKSLILGYTFNDLQIKKYNIEKLRFYFSGTDLFEFSTIKDGYDPEFGESTQSAYPFVRTWAFGVNLSF